MGQDTKDTKEHNEIKDFEIKQLDFANLKLKDLEEYFEEVIKARTSGEWKIEFKNEKYYKHLLSILKNKVSWTGNEAINVVTGTESLKNAVNDESLHSYAEDGSLSIYLKAHEIESIVNMSYRYSSKGAHEAKDFLNAILPFTAIISKMRTMDQELQKIQAEIDVRKAEESEEIMITEEIKEKIITEENKV